MLMSGTSRQNLKHRNCGFIETASYLSQNWRGLFGFAVALGTVADVCLWMQKQPNFLVTGKALSVIYKQAWHGPGSLAL